MKMKILVINSPVPAFCFEVDGKLKRSPKPIGALAMEHTPEAEKALIAVGAEFTTMEIDEESWQNA